MNETIIKEEGISVYWGFSINTFATDYKLIKGVKEEVVNGKKVLSFLTIESWT